MATKASQALHFQPKPTMWEFVEEARFALAKTPKSHINHEIDADLSTSELLQFSSRIPQILLYLKTLDWYSLEEVDLHTPKPPKWHIKHELNAHLSTSTLADSSPLVSLKELWVVDLHYRSSRKSTSSTNLMPICLHLDCSSSPLVSTKYIVCNIAKADSFCRTNLMVKDIRFISYGCMFVATSLSSPTFTADCTWTFMLH